MPDNERGYHRPHVVDKGIVRGVHDTNNVPSFECPAGILGAPLNPDPHGRGFKMPIGDAPSAARPVNDMGPPVHPGGVLNANPHPYNPATQVQQKNTYAM